MRETIERRAVWSWLLIPRSWWGRGALAGVVAIGAMAVLGESCRAMWRGTEPDLAGREPDIRVRVLRGVDSVELGGPGVLIVGRAGDRKRDVLVTPVVIRNGTAGLEAVGAEGERVRAPVGTRLEATPVTRPGRTKTVLIDQVEHAGRVRVLGRDDGRLDVVNVAPIETYVAGVLASELYPDWPRAAFEVQAVCARSYALHVRERALASGRGWDVETTTRDQAYAGRTGLDVAQDAVRSTRGRVLTWEGRVIRAYYSSTNGDRSASASDTWSAGSGHAFNAVPPLRASSRPIACQDSPLFRWTATRNAGSLGRRIASWGRRNSPAARTLGRIASIEVIGRNVVERPTRFAITDTSGRRAELSAEQLRLACNSSAPGLGAVPRADRLRSNDVEVTVRGREVIFEGRGFGHGVGMCQYCARGFGERGMGWREQLEIFYPGAEIERWW
jgi:stage II sporulation protein D